LAQFINNQKENITFHDSSKKDKLKPFYGHKAIIVARSSYLKKQMIGKNKVELSSVNAELFETMLGYMYTGNIRITQDTYNVTNNSNCRTV